MRELLSSRVRGDESARLSGLLFGSSPRRLAALSLALLLVLFLFQTASHLHPNQRDDAACSRCHLSHVGLALGKTNFFLGAPLSLEGQTLPFIPIHPQDPWFQYSPSRAPPAS